MKPRQQHLTELWLRASSGDVAAFADFYDATISQVYALARLRTASQGSAEDVVRDAYVRAWGQPDDFGLSGLSPAAWIACSVGRRRDAVTHDLGMDA